ncbi:PleD family two-component system response regulator [Pararhizobium mangrovi]|uniref:diguanylate cyclase n=1 Tax=Pararhizobium mangrovi TaxID=2590452 RepID=A0A506TXD0_9HYPH|nr:PleD family two-component system response regulator [Pararhizobium mangrovi]TPW25818.1 PleD family two-component system response regulator [Pararhizobium mangrovi]
MTAHILVVDDISANVRLLEARLVAEYYEVSTAENGPRALEICASKPIDLVLLDVMMPEMDGFEVARRLRENSATARIPIVMVTALDGRQDRVTGLEAGADDFLTKPVNDLQLMARVRSLLRLKSLDDELHLRADTARNVAEGTYFSPIRRNDAIRDAAILLVEARTSAQARLRDALRPIGRTNVVADPEAAVDVLAADEHDLVIVGSLPPDADPLRLCAQLRSRMRTRFTPLLVVADADAEPMVRRALEIGVNDYITRPVDPSELVARATTQIRRKRHNQQLRESVQTTMQMAVTDGLTGLSNRNYLDRHLGTLLDRAAAREQPLSICALDIDGFKQINDTYGHDAGDDVLRGIARRIRQMVRGADLACRYGGEEFMVVMPDTVVEDAARIADRLRAAIEASPFSIGEAGRGIAVTASFGIAGLKGASDTQAALMKRSDEALYAAKRKGRNTVVSTAA